MNYFEETQRTYIGPKSYGETSWEYINRSARPEAEAIRNFLNKWLSEYPLAEQNEILGRLSSGNLANFDSACFEIIIYSILRSLGCSVEIHPVLPNGSSSRPDFLVTPPSGDIFYVEAVLASEYSVEERAAQKRMATLLHAIEKVDSPNFFLAVKTSGDPEKPPRGRKIREYLEAWLATLDPCEVEKRLKASEKIMFPATSWEESDWIITFEAIPKSENSRGLSRSSIGMISGGARWTNSWEPIRDAIKDKGGKCGLLGKPYLIAVNVDAIVVDRIDEMQALFGQEQVQINIGGDLDGQQTMTRSRNGAWVGPEGIQYTRVTGAWIFESINFWNIAHQGNNLYINPWCEHALPGILKELHFSEVENEKMIWNKGISLSELLGISGDQNN